MAKAVVTAPEGTITRTEIDYPYKYYPTAMRQREVTREIKDITIWKLNNGTEVK